MIKKRRRTDPGASAEDLIYTDIQAGKTKTVTDPAGHRRMQGLVLALAAVGLALAVVLTLSVSVQRRGERYQYALSLLERKDYTAAAAQLEILEDFRDSEVLLAQLRQKQSDYEAAQAMVDQQRYDDAIAAFRALGDYADSPMQAAYHVTYRKALDLIAETQAGRTQLLTRILSDQVRLTSEGDYTTLLGYEVAAALLESLGDYEDARTQADQALLAAARIKLARENWDGALAYMERMSPETAEAFYQEYLTSRESPGE